MHITTFIKSLEGEAFVKAISKVLGWTYFLAWSISFYPQPYSNFRRGSTHGLAVDFPVLNLLGFSAYTISTAAFYFSPVVRQQYAARHPASPEPTVRFNDFAFALHAAVLCVITYSQFFPRVWGLSVGVRQRPSRLVVLIIVFSLIAVFVGVVKAIAHGGEAGSSWQWIDVVYLLGYVKLLCSLVKYCPQAYLNYRRKSTSGWSIWQILLDFTGGVLSLLQLVLDSALQADWSGIYGNPVKLGLSNTSLFFDVIFMTQHYLLYSHDPAAYDLEESIQAEGEHEPLLESAHEA